MVRARWFPYGLVKARVAITFFNNTVLCQQHLLVKNEQTHPSVSSCPPQAHLIPCFCLSRHTLSLYIFFLSCALQLRRIGDKWDLRQKILNLLAKLFCPESWHPKTCLWREKRKILTSYAMHVSRLPPDSSSYFSAASQAGSSTPGVPVPLCEED
nr:PREDICTED: phorbol-12-myristate-13-acetate-induced protein 1 [Opisthocomus hoazin]